MGEIQHQKVKKNPKTNQTKIQKQKQKSQTEGFQEQRKNANEKKRKLCCTTNMPGHTALLYSTIFFASQNSTCFKRSHASCIPIDFVTNLTKCLVLAEAGKRPKKKGYPWKYWTLQNWRFLWTCRGPFPVTRTQIWKVNLAIRHWKGYTNMAMCMKGDTCMAGDMKSLAEMSYRRNYLKIKSVFCWKINVLGSFFVCWFGICWVFLVLTRSLLFLLCSIWILKEEECGPAIPPHMQTHILTSRITLPEIQCFDTKSFLKNSNIIVFKYLEEKSTFWKMMCSSLCSPDRSIHVFFSCQK